MTEQQYKEFIDMFGDALPANPDNYPNVMQYYIRMFKFLRGYK